MPYEGNADSMKTWSQYSIRTRRTLVASLLFVGLIAIFVMYRAASVAPLHRQSQFVFDTLVEIMVAVRDADQAQQAMAAAYSEMRRIEAVLSRYRRDSQIARINARAGAAVPVNKEVYEILERAQEYARITDGAFNVTIGPLIDAWGIGAEQQRVPDDAELQPILQAVGLEHLDLSNPLEVRLTHPDAALDLGGIAKGYAIDRAVEMLAQHQITSALVNAGGDIRCIGVKPDGTPWQVGLQHPRDATKLSGIVAIDDTAIATSGDYERFFLRDGVRYHHLLHPHTGRPARACQSVTILTDTAEAADVFATALFIMGPDQGLRMLEATPDLEGMIIRADGQILTSSGFDYSPAQ